MMKLERLDSTVQIMDNYSKTHVCLFFLYSSHIYLKIIFQFYIFYFVTYLSLNSNWIL